MSLVQGKKDLENRKKNSGFETGSDASRSNIASLGFRLALTLSAPQCESIADKICEGFDATLTRTLVDFKLGRLQQSQKRYRTLLKDENLDTGIPLIEQDTKITQRTAPLVIFELLFSLNDNANPPAEEIWRYFETISWFDPDDVICHGAVYNALLIFFLRRTDLVAAEELAKLALSAYEECGSAYLQGFIYLHLAYIHVYAGRLNDIEKDLGSAKKAFLDTGDTNCEMAMVEMTRLWVDAERSGILPDPEKLDQLKNDLISGGFWPETILVFANLQLRTQLRTDIDKALMLHSALEAILRARGMTQVLPAMQLLREEVMLPQGNTDAMRYSKPIDLSERQLILLSPKIPALKSNWGEAFENKDLQLPRMRALQSIARGDKYLNTNRFDLAAPQFLSALNIIEKCGLLLLLDTVREPVARFLRECRSRRRFVAQSRHFQTGLMASLDNFSETGKRPIELTPSEFGVLSQLAQSTSNKAMARQLGVSERTIKFHLGNVYRKLGVKTRRDAIKIASAKGWISLEN